MVSVSPSFCSPRFRFSNFQAFKFGLGFSNFVFTVGQNSGWLWLVVIWRDFLVRSLWQMFGQALATLVGPVHFFLKVNFFIEPSFAFPKFCSVVFFGLLQMSKFRAIILSSSRQLFFQASSLALLVGGLTRRAADKWDSPRFLAVFYASAGFRFRAVTASRPLVG